jgi:hypothetical protein
VAGNYRRHLRYLYSDVAFAYMAHAVAAPQQVNEKEQEKSSG